MDIPTRYLKEYRCPHDHKLLCKGYLKDQNSILEVKCRGCGEISTFYGPDAENIVCRSELIKQGLIQGND